MNFRNLTFFLVSLSLLLLCGCQAETAPSAEATPKVDAAAVPAGQAGTINDPRVPPQVRAQMQAQMQNQKPGVAPPAAAPAPPPGPAAAKP